MKKLNVAIIGQGRSGRDIHGKYFWSEANTLYNIVAVVELDSERRERALTEFPGCTVYESYTELFIRNDIDLVVNSTYSEMHYSVTKDLLLHGFNVLVEKPMARSYYECCDLIKTAKDMGVTLAVFQQSFYTPYFEFTKEVVNSGKLGEVLSVDIAFNGFARRWDWQTLQCKMAGCTYNTGPHPVGFAMDFLDFSPEAHVVYSKMNNALASGDAEDWTRMILTAPGKPMVEVQICPTDAFSDYNIKIQGSRGTYQCTTKDYKFKYIVDGENPKQPVIFESLKNADGTPSYCSEDLVSHEESGEVDYGAFGYAVEKFYAKLYDKLAYGTPLEITPEMAADIIRVTEEAHAQNPMPVKF